MTRQVRLNPPISSTTSTFGGYGGYGVLDMENREFEEEEISLDEPLEQSHPITKIPIFYEDSEDYAPFDDDAGQEAS